MLRRSCLKNESTIKVKITGNGTQVSRSMHVLVLAFTILDGNENLSLPSGNHVIAMFNAEEKFKKSLHTNPVGDATGISTITGRISRKTITTVYGRLDIAKAKT